MDIGVIFHGSEQTIGLHVILSNLTWWISLIFVIAAYRNRRIWNIGRTPWIFLFLTFLFFGFREFGHYSELPVIGALRYLSGIFSAIFMTSALILIHRKICMRKTISIPCIIIPLIFALIFPIYMVYLIYEGNDFVKIKSVFFIIESTAWVAGGSIMTYTTYMLGTKSTGDFIRIYMFFQFAAISAIIWKLIGLIGVISCPVPYSVREFMETLLGIFAMIAMYILEKMLRTLSKRIS